MPELPEVETVVQALAKHLPGKVLRQAVSIGKLRLPFSGEEVTAALRGQAITAVRRRAKYIIIEFSAEKALLAHLGMTGFFHLEALDQPYLKHDRIALQFGDGVDLRYADARRFGFVSLVDSPAPGGEIAELSALGVEPLTAGFKPSLLLERAAGRKTPIKVFIMDQTVVVGVGNIYASEALFAAGIDPRRPAGAVSLAEWKSLCREIKNILRKAIDSGGSTIRSYRTVDGSEGGFQRELLVYGKGKEACPRCGEEIQTLRLGGRGTFFCGACQK